MIEMRLGFIKHRQFAPQKPRVFDLSLTRLPYCENERRGILETIKNIVEPPVSEIPEAWAFASIWVWTCGDGVASRWGQGDCGAMEKLGPTPSRGESSHGGLGSKYRHPLESNGLLILGGVTYSKQRGGSPLREVCGTRPPAFHA